MISTSRHSVLASVLPRTSRSHAVRSVSAYGPVVARKSCFCFSTSCTSSTKEHVQASQAASQLRKSENVRLRFAPSPTGSLHLGGLRTALFNHLLARNLGGKWLLRIEDTDRTRFVPGALEELLRCLDWAGLHYDEGPGKEGDCGPYTQSERQDLYQTQTSKLLDSGHAYHCFCPAERLEALRLEARRTKAPTHYDGHCRHLSESEVKQKLATGERHVIRFRNHDLPKDSVDLVYGQLSFPKLPQEDFVLIKGDGMPTYHFANVVDDHHMRISHVLRGEEWIPSLPKHLALYTAFGWQAPAFAHMPILVNPDGSKLSKRSGDVKVSDYIEKGFEPEALVNFVALMGSSWPNLDSEKPVSDFMTMEEMVARFSLSNFNKHRSTMFGGKLSYLNKEHMRSKLQTREGSDNLVRRATAVVSSKLSIDPSNLSAIKMQKALLLGTERIDVVNELPETYPYFFKKADLGSEDARTMRKKLETNILRNVLSESSRILSELGEPWSLDSLRVALQEVASQTGCSGAKLMTPLRYALTGTKSGPGIASLMDLLGKHETLDRLAVTLTQMS